MSLTVDIRHRLPGLALEIAFEAPGGVTALFGRSGAGKTSVINAVAGLLRPDAGRVTLEETPLFDSAAGINLPAHRRELGYVFQDARLFPHLSVQRNLTYGRRFAGTRPGPDLPEVCALLGLEALLERRPDTLSGGERQRVAIGRALLTRPRMLLMDEPLAALDNARKGEILPYLERLRDETGLPILYVSHAVAEVARLATTIVVIDAGRVVRAGPAGAVLSDPGLARQFGVREAGAVLPARVAAHHDDGLTELSVSGGRLFLPRLARASGAPTRVRILAHDVILSDREPAGLSALNVLPVRVVALREGDGPGVICQLQCGEDLLLARVTRRSAAALALSDAQTEGRVMWAVVKSVSVDPVDVSAG